jgi:hypothetical protein
MVVGGRGSRYKDPAARQWIRTFAIITVQPTTLLRRSTIACRPSSTRRTFPAGSATRRSERPACALPVRYAGCKSNRQAFRIAPKRWSTKALTALRVHRAAVPNDRRVGCWQHRAAERNERLRDSPLDARRPKTQVRKAPRAITLYTAVSARTPIRCDVNLTGLFRISPIIGYRPQEWLCSPARRHGNS